MPTLTARPVGAHYAAGPTIIVVRLLVDTGPATVRQPSSTTVSITTVARTTVAILSAGCPVVATGGDTRTSRTGLPG